MRELFLRLSDRKPVILVIDDLQWADVDSAELIKDILRPPDAPALLFIAASRSDPGQASPFVHAFRAEMPVRDIEVAELTPDDSRRLAASLLGDAIAGSSEMANMIADASGGNPLFIDELARSFVLGGDAIRQTSADAIIREVLQARIGRLESGAARMLQYVAVNARPILVPALRLVFRRQDFEATLATLVTQHLVRTLDTAAGEAVETYHDRIAHAAIALLSEDELRDMHAVLALALENFAGVDAELLADHFRAAGMYDRAAKNVMRARE